MTETLRKPLEILGLVDLHWSEKRELVLPDLDGIDLVLLGGDITNFRGTEAAKRVIDRIRSAGPRVFAVCGNCDRREIEALLDEEGLSLDRRVRSIEGVRFAGLSAGLPFGGCPYERTEAEYDEAAKVLSAALRDAESPGPTVLVSHQPPRDTVCDLSRGQHVGSTSIRRFILESCPDVVLCGHIHEGIGVERLGESRVVNPGPWFAGNSVRLRASASGVEILESLQAGNARPSAGNAR